ncbi:hypothetical protein LTR36_000793 [Oleoguttula mirabilis]|uniref:Uncharacterized protein n=1 Tax=Oleoguttula mirabilis TaxID=1507867 RepID=A0AAV9J3X9_9PEZI|nr:hypothetical protein LTR36_000793 [Oleoguttula mirabilis]
MSAATHVLTTFELLEADGQAMLRWATDGADEINITVKMNPLFGSVLGLTQTEFIRVHDDLKAGSWEDMHITSPPAYAVEFVCVFYTSCGDMRRAGEEYVRSDDGSGVRMVS